MAVVRQCVLAGVSRATIYAQRVPPAIDDGELLMSRLIDEEYTRRPFYGSRKMVIFLRQAGHVINRKRVQRLMQMLGLAGMAPGPNTSRPHPEHKIYPYVLRGVPVVRPNQVWSTDLTYVRLARGFVYLVAIIDWYSRRVLGWRISNSMEAAFCVDCLEEALRNHGRPEVFNSDQGSQFTSAAFTGVLKREGIVISMDGRGRAFDQPGRPSAVIPSSSSAVAAWFASIRRCAGMRVMAPTAWESRSSSSQGRSSCRFSASNFSRSLASWTTSVKLPRPVLSAESRSPSM